MLEMHYLDKLVDELAKGKPWRKFCEDEAMLWMIAAILSAVFAGVTSILAKCGIKKTDSDLATAIRTVVVLIFSWVMVFVVGSQGTIVEIEP